MAFLNCDIDMMASIGFIMRMLFLNFLFVLYHIFRILPQMLNYCSAKPIRFFKIYSIFVAIISKSPL